MKVPVIQNIEVSSLNEEILLKSLLDAHVGENPISIQISPGLSNHKAEEILKALNEILNKIQISPKLPYPVFILYPHNIISKQFVIFKTDKELSNYYRLKLKKLKKREMSLLSKVKILTTRINNYKLDEHLAIIKSQSVKHKKLKVTCIEKSFYTSILEDILEAEG